MNTSKENESRKHEETVEHVDSTLSSESTPEVDRESSNDLSRKSPTAESLERYEGLRRITYGAVKRFVPKATLIPALFEALAIYAETEDRVDASATEIIESCIAELTKNDHDWKERLDCIFDGEYPLVYREAFRGGQLVTMKYPKPTMRSNQQTTYEVPDVRPIPAPKKLLCSKIAPALFDIESDSKGKLRAEPTAEVERFLNGERDAVPKSSLHEIVLLNRPTAFETSRWEPIDKTKIPRQIIAPTLKFSNPKHGIVEEFIDDLRETFAWDRIGYLYSYLGYLLQPMLAHFFRGQGPGYLFSGPSNAGKGYLSNALPQILYMRDGENTVVTKKLPENTYEFEVLLGSVGDALYLCFDEAKNANDEQMKLIDAFATQQTVQMRRMRIGYTEVDNLYTIALTAVHRNYSDETNGRMATIKLKESRPEAISGFNHKWGLRGAELLAALFARISSVSFTTKECPPIPNRRAGFAVMAHVLQRTFGVVPDYQVEVSNNEILDDLCAMYEIEPKLGDTKGGWKRYSPRMITNHLAAKGDKMKRENLMSAVHTSLGYSSTRNHPAYKETGYSAESGKRYHLEVREEGEKQKRVFVYIRHLAD